MHLGSVRLSIIDLATGQQPISNEDDTVHVVFNGEIYNYLDLRGRLQSRGHVFRTQSDTEILVHLYEDHGADLADHLLGDFALAVWDDRTQTLLLARDRLGVKPLFYADVGGLLCFASEMSALLTCDRIPRRLDHAALETYLLGRWIPCPRSIYADVRKLPPGHRLIVQNGVARVSRYWDVHFEPDESRREDDVADELRALVDDAVRRQLMSEVPLGAFLSGGVDSSTVVASMVRASQTTVKTFSIGFKETRYDESPYFRLVAQQFGTEHHEFVFEPDLLTIIPTLVYHFGEPCAISSAMPIYYLCQMARQHVTVALSGDGGDELFAGYNTYNTMNRLRLVDRSAGWLIGSRWLATMLSRLQLPTTSRVGNLVRRLRKVQRLLRLPPSQWMSSIGNVFDFGQSLLATPSTQPPTPEYDAAFERGRRGHDWLAPYLYADIKVLLPEEMLTKLDRMSMAHSLEGRVPLIDHRLVELAARIPSRMKLKHGTVKAIFKRAMRARLPQTVLTRPKVGFTVPLNEWFRGPLRPMAYDLLTDASFRQSGLFNIDHVQQLVDRHMAGLDNHGEDIFKLLVFETWRRNLHERSPLPATPS